MTTNQRHADEVLQRFRRRRPTPACYPCSKRKVRCTGGRPCGTCIARGHADICHDDQQRVKSSSRSATGDNLSPGTDGSSRGADATTAATTVPFTRIRIQQPSPISPDPTEHSHPTSLSSAEPRVGKFSAMTFIRDRLRNSRNTIPNGELHPTIGLGNAEGQLPMLAPMTAIATNAMLPPSRKEVLRFYPPFRDCVVPLYPVIPHTVAFESTLHRFLTESPNTFDDTRVAMILASLALGAQFEEIASKPRSETSLELINRSNTYLQRANYVFHPTLEAVQALLMIGMVLQNTGRPDGAWNLLGLNYRLAQTLGLHLLDPNDEKGGAGATVWSTLIWQDSLLSCRYDRRPLADLNSIIELNPVSQLSYYQALRGICALDIDLLGQPQTQRLDAEYVNSVVGDLDNLLSRCTEHLLPNGAPGQAQTFQQRLQQAALKLHSSLFLADLCRPMFSITTTPTSISTTTSSDNDKNTTAQKLRSRGCDALKANIDAYLSICSFSNIPLRQWSMTQATVSCAIVLATLITQDPRTSSRNYHHHHPPATAITTTTNAITKLLRRLADTLKSDMDSAVSSANHFQGVCRMRLKGSRLLEALLDDFDASVPPPPASLSSLPRKEESTTSGSRTQEHQAGPVAASPVVVEPTAATLEVDSLLPSAEDLAWPADLPVFDRAFFAETAWEFDLDQSWLEENLGAEFG